MKIYLSEFFWPRMLINGPKKSAMYSSSLGMLVRVRLLLATASGPAPISFDKFFEVFSDPIDGGIQIHLKATIIEIGPILIRIC